MIGRLCKYEISVVRTTELARVTAEKIHFIEHTVEPGYNVGLCVTSPILSDILWYQLIPHC